MAPSYSKTKSHNWSCYSDQNTATSREMSHLTSKPLSSIQEFTAATRPSCRHGQIHTKARTQREVGDQAQKVLLGHQILHRYSTRCCRGQHCPGIRLLPAWVDGLCPHVSSARRGASPGDTHKGQPLCVSRTSPYCVRQVPACASSAI